MKFNIHLTSEYKGIFAPSTDTSPAVHEWGVKLINDNGEILEDLYFSDTDEKPTLGAVVHQIMGFTAVTELAIRLSEDGRTDLLERRPFNTATSEIDIKILEQVRKFFGPAYWSLVTPAMAKIIETVEQAESSTFH